MKTILILADWFAPAFKAGGPVHSLNNLITQYARQEQQFAVIARNTDHDGTKLSVEADAWTPFLPSTQVWYASERTSLIQHIRLLWQHRQSVWYINGIFSFRYNLLPMLLPFGAAKIVSPRGMFDAGALSQKATKKRYYIQLLKLMGIQRNCTFHAASAAEVKGIQHSLGKTTTVVQIPNYPKLLPILPPPVKESGWLRLVTIALVGPMKNHLPVLNALQQCTGQIQYDIYGPILDEGYWQTCESIIAQMPANIRVHYHGNLPPEQISSVLQDIHVMIQPSKSENFGHSLYECLISGRPLITSNTTPWLGLQAANAGINVVQGEVEPLVSAFDFFTAMPQDVYVDWCAGARTYVEAAVQVDAIQQQYEALFAGQ